MLIMIHFHWEPMGIFPSLWPKSSKSIGSTGNPFRAQQRGYLTWDADFKWVDPRYCSSEFRGESRDSIIEIYTGMITRAI